MLPVTMAPPPSAAHSASLRERLYEVIFEAETPAGRLFDVVLLWVIVASVFTVALESVAEVAHDHRLTLRVLEWVFTVLFTVEYVLRVYSARRRLRYVVSFFGVIDLLALLPAFLAVLLPGAQSLLVIRALRLLRAFRVLKVVRLMHESHKLVSAIRNSLPKISVFLGTVTIVALIFGAAMHVIEGADAGFTSIPRGMYWAIVTMTTVGYGDIAPKTGLGQLVTACLMTLGYGILAVPTGILSAEMVRQHDGETKAASASNEAERTRCHACEAEGHPKGAGFCYVCGTALD
jgi:voltage-gated potassium channel